MRGLQFSLTQSQKVRLQRALEKLEASNSNASVTVVNRIPVNYDEGFLKGHGTIELNGEVVSTICGVVERVNKLVYVRTLRARYKPEVGDIIVGRIIEVTPKRWQLDINYSQDAVLMLSSINFPNGIQRRRTAEDELSMRSIFEENDVICAEVRSFQHDGLHLQARSQKYGKLQRGQLLSIPPYLVKRRKQHWHYLEEYGIDLILGCNGFVWVGEHVEAKDEMLVDQANKPKSQASKTDDSSMSLEGQEQRCTLLETRQNVCRIANAICILSMLGFTVTIEVIMEVVNLGLSQNTNTQEMLGPEFCVLVAEMEAERRSQTKKKG